MSRYDRLLDALLDDGHVSLVYHHSAEFHHAVQLIARTLPVFLQHMADQAAADQNRLDEAARLMERTPLVLTREQAAKFGITIPDGL